MKVLNDGLDAAISTTKAAVAEAIVPGGGLALLRCIPHLETLAAECEDDQRTGLQILMRALQAPARLIAEIAALDGGGSWQRCFTAREASALTPPAKHHVDLVEAGIVDPTRVVRIALENAVSMAPVVLLTEATITDIPEKGKVGPISIPEF